MIKKLKAKKWLPALLLFGVAVCMIILFSLFLLKKDRYGRDARQIREIVEEDAAQRGLADQRMIVPHELLQSMDWHRREIDMPYHHEALKGQPIETDTEAQIFRIMSNDEKNWEALSWYAAREEYDYLAYPHNKEAEQELSAQGYKKIGSTDNFEVYRLEDKDHDGSWIVTQYGNPAGNQSMFYTLQNAEGLLIVVDGGWTTDAEYVRQVIADLGNHVTAWFITHPHADHAGAFCEIYPTPGEMLIDRVYAVDMASPELCLENASWDDVTLYRQWLQLDISQLTYVYEGDRFTVDDLDFEILSAYDDYVDELSNDLLNDGSMMFKVSAEKESMLFCADVGINMTNHILNSAAGSLKADYMQIGHHGNGGLADYFYRQVSPKAAFFDAPNWLMDDPEDRFTTPENKQLMLEMGAEVYSFSTAPNQFVLE